MHIPIVKELSRMTAHPAQRAPAAAHRPPRETRSTRVEHVVPRRSDARS
jgi:hypothetical protein